MLASSAVKSVTISPAQQTDENAAFKVQQYLDREQRSHVLRLYRRSDI